MKGRTLLRVVGQRKFATTREESVQACIVGGGPAGLTALSNLLDAGLDRILWVDKGGIDKAGRLSNYREVPSNTRAVTFSDYGHGTQAFQDILRNGGDNPITRLEALPQKEECPLGYAVDMVAFLKQRLQQDPRVSYVHGQLTAGEQDHHNQWKLDIHNDTNKIQQSIKSPLLVLATGSHPSTLLPSVTSNFPKLIQVDLDTVLSPSLFGSVGISKDSKVAVVGSSHSGILALRNLYMAGIPVINFYRSPLRFAEYKEGWILYDNTGLKGIAANWAKETLADDASRNTDLLSRVQLPKDSTQEAKVYAKYLPGCTHIVQAVGFKRNRLPDFTSAGQTVNTQQYNDSTGMIGNTRGLYGCGIAYPEKVIDKANNTEHAVGLWKFMKYAKKVTPEWAKSVA